jgi:septal ring factor EnvC (AmiA/AmiB activator)
MMSSCNIKLFDKLSDEQIAGLFKDSPADAETNLAKAKKDFEERSTKFKQIIEKLEKFPGGDLTDTEMDINEITEQLKSIL